MNQDDIEVKNVDVDMTPHQYEQLVLTPDVELASGEKVGTMLSAREIVVEYFRDCKCGECAQAALNALAVVFDVEPEEAKRRREVAELHQLLSGCSYTTVLRMYDKGVRKEDIIPDVSP